MRDYYLVLIGIFWGGFFLPAHFTSAYSAPPSLREALDTQSPVALVTGGSRGIGKAFARLLAEQGLDLFLVARDPARLEQTKTEIEAEFGVEVRTFAIDLSDQDAAEQVLSAIPEEWISRLAVHVFSAGMAVCDICSAEEIQRMRQVKGGTARKLAEGLLNIFENNQRRSITLFVASMAGLTELGGMRAYSWSNRELIELTEILRKQWGRQHLISTLAPGFTDTDMLGTFGFEIPHPPGTLSPSELATLTIDELLRRRRPLIVVGLINKIVVSYYMSIAEPLGLMAPYQPYMEWTIRTVASGRNSLPKTVITNCAALLARMQRKLSH